MAEAHERARIGLLVRRAGFGASPEEMERYVRLGLDGTLDELLHPERAAGEFDGLLESLEGHLLDLQNIEDVQTWWLYRLVRTRRPLLEKLTLFWHGHFAVSNAKVQNPLAMHGHLELLRQHALASYREMLAHVSRDPAMLLWLDGATNRKAAPNENYGRELLELYTLGIGHYTEADVQAAARAFTGWNLRNGVFFFDRNQHDFSPQTFLGRSGPLDGTDVIDALVGHPATAQRIARKLFAFFAHPNPEPAAIDPLAAIYSETGGQIRPLVGAILTSEAFYSDRSRYGHVKSPVEYAVGAIRMLGARVRERGLIQALRGMGQEILLPPNVAGWAGGPAWVSPSTMLTRFNFAARLATARGEPNDGGQVRAADLLDVDGDLSNPNAVVDRLFELLGGLEVGSEARQALVEYLAAPLTYPPYVKGPPNPQQRQLAIDARLRGAIQLALVTPEFQVG